MAKNIGTLARKLGATVVGTVPESSAGAFGIAALASTLSLLLEPSVGKDSAATRACVMHDFSAAAPRNPIADFDGRQR